MMNTNRIQRLGAKVAIAAMFLLVAIPTPPAGAQETVQPTLLPNPLPPPEVFQCLQAEPSVGCYAEIPTQLFEDPAEPIVIDIAPPEILDSGPEGGESSDGFSTQACGWLHVHGAWKGSYYYGTTQVHLHHCGGYPNHWNGWVAYSSSNGSPSLSYYGHDAVKVYFGDWKYHYVCIWMQQQDGTWVGSTCYWQYN